VEWIDTIATNNYVAQKLLTITQTPLMTQADVVVTDGGAQTCTHLVTGATVQCYHWTAKINVWAEYAVDLVAQRVMETLIGVDCLDNHVAITALASGKCESNTATEKVEAFFTQSERGTFSCLSVMEGGMKVTITTMGTVFAQSNGDPHIHRADGRKTDFRGEDGKIFNMLSARNVSLGVRTVESHFMQKFGSQKVHGTHFSEAFFTLRSNETGTIITAKVDALITPWVDPVTYVAISGHEKYPIKLSSSTRPTYAIEDINITAVSGSKIVVRGASWEVSITRRLLYKPLPESKTKNFLDIAIRRIAKDPRALSSHGVIGQSFDPKHRIAKDGKTDDYSTDEVTTTAQAEGAIQGVYTDYMVAAPFQTTFKYSLFDAQPEKATAASKAEYLTEAFSETTDAVANP